MSRVKIMAKIFQGEGWQVEQVSTLHRKPKRQKHCGTLQVALSAVVLMNQY